MASVGESDWVNNENLESDLKKYVMQNLKRKEVLDFVRRDYPQYAWSLSTLSRRLTHFDIRYMDYDLDLKEIERAVHEEIEGPGQLLGYRAMQRKLREKHNLAVPRSLVYSLMSKLDPEGLDRRGNVGQKKRRRGGTGTFTSLVSS